MLFYLPRQIEAEASGSLVRIRAMRAAFAALGLEVVDLAGPLSRRLPVMRTVLRQFGEGARFDFVYLENATLPLHLCEPRGRILRRHPFADAAFLAACRRAGVPVGVFYRDVWWRFRRDLTPAQQWRHWFRLPFYRLELELYRRFAEVLYLPHLAMAALLPVRPARVRALPPGADPEAASRVGPPPARAPGVPLRLFYVGGLGYFYELHGLVAAVQRTPGVELTLCCREDDWARARHGYPGVPDGRIRIVHTHGPGLLPYIRAADILSCHLRPHPYWRVTMPIKVIEYLGYGRPILAAADTNAGTFVAEHRIGWQCADDPAGLATLLARLRDRPDEVAAYQARIPAVRAQHSWTSRARQVIADLAPARLAAGAEQV